MSKRNRYAAAALIAGGLMMWQGSAGMAVLMFICAAVLITGNSRGAK